MKFALILPSNIWYCPYLNIYTKVLNELGVDYDIISWNRDGTEQNRGIQYNALLPYGSSSIKSLVRYYSYSMFIQQVLDKHRYEKLVIFGPQLAIFLSSYLSKKYVKRYIIDYRDLSIEQRFYFKHSFEKALKYSTSIFISSPGFEKYLPNGFDYKLSHNFDIDLVKKAVCRNGTRFSQSGKYNVLTIGSIRDYAANAEVIQALANFKDFNLKFVGKGVASSKLEFYSSKIGAKNVDFLGYYQKEEEGGFIQNSSILNIYYPKIKSHSSALSNRFYNALIYKRPMIVTSNSIQAYYVEKYHLGVSVDDCVGLGDKLISFLTNVDVEEFNKRCNCLLDNFIEDYNRFYSSIKELVEA